MMEEWKVIRKLEKVENKNEPKKNEGGVYIQTENLKVIKQEL